MAPNGRKQDPEPLGHKFEYQDTGRTVVREETHTKTATLRDTVKKP